MKWAFVLLNLAAAGAVIWAGYVLCGVHRVHSFSVLRDLENRGAIVKSPPMNVEESLKSIGGLDYNLPIITYTAAGLFVLNALAFMVVWKGKPAPAPDRTGK